MTGILYAAGLVGGIGLLIGLLLGFAAIKLAVPVDEKEEAVRELLPGNNCGGCGYAGCDALAKAIAAGEAPVTACPVGGKAVADKIAAVMGVEAGEFTRKVAHVKCEGSCEKAPVKANYYGITDCRSAAAVPGGGDKACSYGCMGLGSCVSVCSQDAIHIVHGIAVVDKEKCGGCTECTKECPRGLIEMIPYDAKWAVGCSNQDKGPAVMKVCEVGCIGCGICEKNCPKDAIHVENNIAHIDQDKCVGCGICAQKCPKKIIMAQ